MCLTASCLVGATGVFSRQKYGPEPAAFSFVGRFVAFIMRLTASATFHLMFNLIYGNTMSFRLLTSTVRVAYLSIASTGVPCPPGPQ